MITYLLLISTLASKFLVTSGYLQELPYNQDIVTSGYNIESLEKYLNPTGDVSIEIVRSENNERICKNNEKYDCCVNGHCGPKNCTELDEPIKCVKIDPENCRSGCLCKYGYLRNSYGICVPRRICNLERCLKPNELFVQCLQTCSPQTCESIGKVYSCPAIPVGGVCTGECRCDKGYYRNKIGDCISESDCKKCSGQNEYFSCGVACDNVCATLSEQNQTNCPIENIVCNKMCYCVSGYARNDNGTCVPFNQCPDKQPSDKNAAMRLDQANDAFTGEFLYQLFLLSSGRSFVASPFSVFIPLAQLCLFAKGETFNQLLKVLNLKSKDEIQTVFPALVKKFNEQQDVELILAATYYADLKFPLSETFKRVSLEVLRADGQNVDFSNPAQAANIINSWVNQKTKGLIPTLVSPSSINDSTRMMMVDVLYFLGNWTKPFQTRNTKEKNFYLTNNKTITVKTMSQKDYFLYADSSNLNAQVIQLFYKGGNLSFVIILPREINGIDTLINKCRDGTALQEELNTTSTKKVQLDLPSFNITSTIDLADILKKDNVTSLFDKSSNDLEGILEIPEPLYVSAATQKCVAQVNEFGTVAAAANAIIVGTRTPILEEEVISFIADRAFLFYICFENNPIFCGTYTGLE